MIRERMNQQSRMQVLLSTLSACLETGRGDHGAKASAGGQRLKETAGRRAKQPIANLLEQLVASSGKGEIRTTSIATINAVKITDFIQPATA